MIKTISLAIGVIGIIMLLYKVGIMSQHQTSLITHAKSDVLRDLGAQQSPQSSLAGGVLW